MGTKLDFSIAYHPQSDGQTERVNKVLEDLLRACVLTFDRNWESSLPYTTGIRSIPVGYFNSRRPETGPTGIT
jgi:hypothetical protein